MNSFDLISFLLGAIFQMVIVLLLEKTILKRK